MRLRLSLIGLLALALPSASHANQEETEERTRTSAYGAFSRGDSLTWDQLQIVAQDAGMSPTQLNELKIRDRVLKIIQKFQLPLQFVGFSSSLPADEEFRVKRGSPAALGAVELSSAFWDRHAALSDNEPYLLYILLRAQAYYAYRSHYDPEHCTWIIREESEPLENSFQFLRTSLDQTAAVEEIHGPLTDRDKEFRRKLEPSGDPVRTLGKLVDFALRCIAEKAADNWALSIYRQRVGEVPSVVTDRIRERERYLADDFGRARFAMTLAERITFHRILKTPFRYAETMPHPKNENNP